MTNSPPSPKVALISGASSGIGAEVALDLARRGFRVALLARRADRLAELKAKIEALGGEALALTADVTAPASIDAAVKKVIEQWGRLDVVLANAGFGVNGPLATLCVDDYRRQFETNVFGVLNTIYATKDAVTLHKGILGIVGSVAGHLPLPYVTAYSMSKFAVRALAGGLRQEMSKKGVAVVLVSPGFIDTEIVNVDNDGKWQEKAVKHFPAKLVVPVAKAAHEIVDGLLSRRREVVVTFHGKFMILLHRLFPSFTMALAAKVK